MKDYREWMPQKASINNKATYPTFNEGEIWWGTLGKNIGVEIDGKGDTFSRPIIIFRKLSREGLLAIPLSTRPKDGSWYVRFDFAGKEQRAVLAQMRIISAKRLSTKIGTMSGSDFTRIKTAFATLYLKLAE